MPLSIARLPTEPGGPCISSGCQQDPTGRRPVLYANPIFRQPGVIVMKTSSRHSCWAQCCRWFDASRNANVMRTCTVERVCMLRSTTLRTETFLNEQKARLGRCKVTTSIKEACFHSGFLLSQMSRKTRTSNNQGTRKRLSNAWQFPQGGLLHSACEGRPCSGAREASWPPGPRSSRISASFLSVSHGLTCSAMPADPPDGFILIYLSVSNLDAPQ